MVMNTAQQPVQVGSPAVPQAPVQSNQQRMNPFRRATVERHENLLQIAKTQTASEQQNINKLIGTGFMRTVRVKCATVTAGNAATVTFNEDAPFSSISALVLHDVNGDLINLQSAYHCYLAMLYNGVLDWPFFPPRFAGAAALPTGTTLDTNIYSAPLNTGGTGGSSTFWIELSVAIDDRDLIGLVGNQNQAQAYDLRSNFAASGQVYGTAPTTLGTVTQTVYYESRTVPNPANPDGSANQVIPNTYGILHYWLDAVDQSAPVGGSTITHRLQRLGQTLRSIGLVLRQNTGAANPRAAAEPNMPSSIQVKVGDQPLFVEDTSLRRELTWKRRGFDSPNGVLWYDWEHDFDGQIGQEYGNDWIYSQDIVQFMFQNTYPSGLGSTANTLTYITDDLSIPAGIDPYNP